MERAGFQMFYERSFGGLRDKSKLRAHLRVLRDAGRLTPRPTLRRGAAGAVGAASACRAAEDRDGRQPVRL